MKIKVSAGDKKLTDIFLRQTPGRLGKWSGLQFFINSDIKDCDWWFICHSSGITKKETVLCDPDKIIYFSMEPYEFDNPLEFIKQFKKLVLCDRAIIGHNVKYFNPITWWVGIEVKFNGGHLFSNIIKQDYDSLTQMKCGEKINKISVICSNKNIFPGHKKRVDFLERLKNHPISKYIDFYGAGFAPVLDKMDAILPYKYHLVMENSVVDDYWSEKLGDSFLGFSLPIYHGCPNLDKYFSDDSFISINIDNFEEAIQIIEGLVKNDVFADRFDKIIESRDLILNNYNIFEVMAKIANDKTENKILCTIFPIDHFREFSLKRLFSIYLKKIGLFRFVKLLIK